MDIAFEYVSIVVLNKNMITNWIHTLQFEQTVENASWANKDIEPKGSLRIHSPDSENNKIQLKRDPKWTTLS